MTRPISRASLLIALVSTACGSPTTPADAGQDAGPTVLPTCADPATTYAFPSPRWIGASGLVVPADDLAGQGVRQLAWVEEVESLDAWPRRPTWVVPLDRAAGAVDPSLAHVAVLRGGAFEVLDVELRVENPAPQYLAVTPLNPLPPEAGEVIFALERGVAGEALPLAVCEGDAPHPEQVAAADAWPDAAAPIEAAIRLTIADGSAPLVALRERLATTSALVVSSSAAVTLTELGADGPAADEAMHFAATALRGQLALPDYRREGLPMEIDADGAPVVQGVTEPEFIVALPATGTAPYPVILYQHGGGQSPLDVFDVGARFVEQGFAFVAIDLPEHGLRAPPGGGGDLAFLDFDSPLATRENFRQAAADHLAVLNGFTEIEAAIEAELMVAGAFDEDRRFYMGMSLGAVSGSLTTASSRGLVASALFVGGAGYPELMGEGAFALAATRIITGAAPRGTVMLSVVETIGDASDPLAYAIAAEDRTAAPTPILFLQAVDDPIVSHSANEQWARAFGASLARPIDHPALGMTEVDLPVRDTFSFTVGGPTATRVLVQNPMNEIVAGGRHGGLILTDYAQAMVVRCFVSARDEGGCEVIDTGFNGR